MSISRAISVCLLQHLIIMYLHILSSAHGAPFVIAEVLFVTAYRFNHETRTYNSGPTYIQKQIKFCRIVVDLTICLRFTVVLLQPVFFFVYRLRLILE